MSVELRQIKSDDEIAPNDQNDEAGQIVPDEEIAPNDRNNDASQMVSDEEIAPNDQNVGAGQIVPIEDIAPTDQNDEQTEADYFEDRVARGQRLGYAGVKINVWEILSHVSFVSGIKI